MIITKYIRLAPAALTQTADIFKEPVLRGPPDLLGRLASKVGIVLGRWDAGKKLGMVSALGVVIKSSAAEAMIDWREVDVSFKPNGADKVHWIHKTHFSFSKEVVMRYCLADLFAERFPDLLNDKRAKPDAKAVVERRLPTGAVPGYVYVIESEYGFKVGKTADIENRTQSLELKQPFPVNVEHYAWFDDAAKAERSFHEMFRNKRLEGEWFDLDAADLALIKS